MTNRKVFILFTLLFCLGFSACSFMPLNSVPYMVTGDFVMEEACEEYSVCGIELLFFNQSDKRVKNFSIVFFLFDKDGEPARECSNRISFDIEKTVEARDSFSKCLSLDKYMKFFPEELLWVDYLYVSRIDYEDGTFWEDPYGLVAFK